MNPVTTRTGGRRHVLLSSVTLCGLTIDLEPLLLPEALPGHGCMNCKLKLERLQRRTRRLNARIRARDRRPKRARRTQIPTSTLNAK